ncbi:hypothetical protein ACCS56_37855, partial [Rhizobium ruizarguesonis]
IGQCCGGRTQLRFRRVTSNAAPTAPETADNNDQGRAPRDGHDGRDGQRWMRQGGNINRASLMMKRIDTDHNRQISKQ